MFFEKHYDKQEYIILSRILSIVQVKIEIMAGWFSRSWSGLGIVEMNNSHKMVQ